MAIKQVFKRGGWVLLIIALVACISKQETNMPAQRVSVPPGSYGTVLRFSEDKILIGTGFLRYFVLGEDHFVEIPFEKDKRCRQNEYTLFSALPDGRLGVNMICRSYWSDRPIGRDDARFIMAYDWETGTIEQIVAEPLPFESLDFSWNPDMTRGVQGIGSLLSTIYWLTPIGMEPMTITIGTGEQSWSLDENLVAMYNFELDDNDVGIARSPAWSPDGRFIAFWASTDVIGRSGQSRARGAYGLYLLSPDTLQLQPILEDVRNTGSLVWSPDSQWLTFIGDIGSSKDSLWLISVDGNILQLVDKGSDLDFYAAFNGWNWLNEQEIIATRCLDTDCNQAEVVKYNVSVLVGSVSE